MKAIFLIYVRMKFQQLLKILRLKMQMWKTRLMGPWGRSCRNLDWMGKQLVEPLVEVLMVWGLMSLLVHRARQRNRGARRTRPIRPLIR